MRTTTSETGAASREEIDRERASRGAVVRVSIECQNVCKEKILLLNDRCSAMVCAEPWSCMWLAVVVIVDAR